MVTKVCSSSLGTTTIQVDILKKS